MGFRKHLHHHHTNGRSNLKSGIVFGILGILLLIIVIILLNNYLTDLHTPKCDDGTYYSNCSNNKPYYCNDGNLVEQPILCGCANEYILQDSTCVSIYNLDPKTINLDYILRGNKGNIEYTVYGGLNNYLAGLDRTFWYDEGSSPPTNEYMELEFITESHQSNFILPLVYKIQQLTDNTDDQARIAISIVQSMPYDLDSLNNNKDNRYAYETLYDQTGVCADKSYLLAVFLKELGYGVVLFNYSTENHEAIGIKCPMEYSYLDSGYCFVETTNPTIVTDSEEEYIGVGKLTTNPEIYKVSAGKSFDSVTEEYNDYQTYKKLLSKGNTLSEADYATWKHIVDKYGFKFND